MIETFDVNSRIIRVKLFDSTVTTGAGKTGLAYNTSGLIISTIADNEATATTYTAAGSTIETIATLGTYAAPTATKCRFKEVDATNHPGLYELQFADARLGVVNAKELIVSISGATGLAQCDLRIQLAQFDLMNDATPSVDAIQISGDATAADNLELMFDGTGYAGGTTKLAVDASASAVASVTAGVTLADDAITSAKFDESTAFPLKSADAGATEVGRKGASAVTLSSISLGVDDGLDAAGVRAALGMAAADLDDQLDALPSAQEIWQNSERTLTQTAEQVAAILGGTALALKRGDTFVQAFTGLGDITGNKKIWFTVKRHAAETDAQSVLQIQRTVGAVYLNGAAATASDGSITVDDAAAGDITVRLKATASDDLPSGSYIYDIQWLTAADEVHTLYEGALTISLDVTRAVA